MASIRGTLTVTNREMMGFPQPVSFVEGLWKGLRWAVVSLAAKSVLWSAAACIELVLRCACRSEQWLQGEE